MFRESYNFDFFQAVRLLYRLFPERKPSGGTDRPNDEFVRFRHVGSCEEWDEARRAMVFPPSAVHRLDRARTDSGAAQMFVAFLGLTGTQGVLPLWYTEWMMGRRLSNDGALAAFLDLFEHRLVSLFYRAWETRRPPVLYEVAAIRKQRPDRFTAHLFALAGVGTAGLLGRMRIADETLAWYAGLIAQRPHSASALRGVLRDYFGVQVEIEQCLGGWHTLDPSDRCDLAGETEPNELGEAAFLGDEVWNPQSRFRVRIGPLGLGAFLSFLPDGSAMAKLVEFTTFLVGHSIDFDVQVILRADDVPCCVLEDGAAAPRLGWIGWLKTESFEADAADAVFAGGN